MISISKQTQYYHCHPSQSNYRSNMPSNWLHTYMFYHYLIFKLAVSYYVYQLPLLYFYHWILKCFHHILGLCYRYAKLDIYIHGLLSYGSPRSVTILFTHLKQITIGEVQLNNIFIFIEQKLSHMIDA